ncbi:hypothetical protein J4443_04170 [Candidatus Woesearchaeota archaeon]|nr:hypothetical protein [Candidatus Woesearchaeota archaeon]
MAGVLETVVAIRSPFEALWIGFIKFFPDLIAVILLLLIGYLFGLVLGTILKSVLQKAGLDRYAEKAALSKAIGKTHISFVLGEILKWYVFIIFLQAAVDKIDLGSLSGVLNSFVLWLPDLIFGIVIILFGLVFAHYVEIKINEYSKVKGMLVLSKIIKWFILFVIVMTAFRQIGIQVGLIENVFLIIIGALAAGIALALGIGLGLGLKKDAERLIRDFMRNF